MVRTQVTLLLLVEAVVVHITARRQHPAGLVVAVKVLGLQIVQAVLAHLVKVTLAVQVLVLLLFPQAVAVAVLELLD